mgnify:CR=1 FL=1
MGIEYLNSAAAAAGFAMVSEESADETDLVRDQSRYAIADSHEDSGSASLPAVIDPNRPSAPSLGARVSGLLDSWLSKS